MIVYTNVNVWIKDVESITDESVQSDPPERVYQRTITVRTARGETFALLLQAPKKQNLKFRKKPQSDWRTPVIYVPDNDKA
jgi:hypothetical protein